MTIALIISLGLLLIAAGVTIVKPLRRRQRRQEVMARPFPEAWDLILEERFGLDARMPGELRTRLRQHIQVFLDEKNFEPCGELDEVTDEMKVLVAAQACLLLIGLKKHRYFPKLTSVLMYPGAYRDRGHRRFSLHESQTGDSVRLGESWPTGSVVLSWQNVKAGAANADDGLNVVFHEFAHQLDQVDGAADGAPVLHHSDEYKDWSEVLQRDYEKLVEATNDHRKEPLLDPYGATNPAEFFAVATETFFEESRDLREEHPELYRELKGYYGLDPATWARR